MLDIDLPWLDYINRPNRPKRLPSVLSKEEVSRLLAAMDGEVGLLARLLYGTGMRLMEALRLRIKDVEFDRRVIIVREGKGGKDRGVMLPRGLESALKAQMATGRALRESDRQFVGRIRRSRNPPHGSCAHHIRRNTLRYSALQPGLVPQPNRVHLQFGNGNCVFVISSKRPNSFNTRSTSATARTKRGMPI